MTKEGQLKGDFWQYVRGQQQEAADTSRKEREEAERFERIRERVRRGHDLRLLDAPDEARRILDRLQVRSLLEEVKRDFDEWGQASLEPVDPHYRTDPAWGYALARFIPYNWSYTEITRPGAPGLWHGPGSQSPPENNSIIHTVQGYHRERAIRIATTNFVSQLTDDGIWVYANMQANRSKDELRAFVGDFLSKGKKCVYINILTDTPLVI